MRAADRPAWTSAPDRRPETAAPLSGLRPLELEPVTDTEGRQLWNASVDRHHHPGYRRPFGARVRHSVTDRDGRRLGCIPFGAVRRTLPCRDRWVGWSDRVRDRHLMVVSPRYLVSAWVRSRFPASPARSPGCPPCRGHRVLAVDGGRLTLPRPPADRGFRVADGAHRPQGMPVVLHRLRDRTPVDLHLSGHGNGARGRTHPSWPRRRR